MSTIGKRGRTVSEIRKGLAFNKSWGDTACVCATVKEVPEQDV